PNCDYNLAGLTTRRCPECGRDFTLTEALRHGHCMESSAIEHRHGMVLRWLILQAVGLALIGSAWIIVHYGASEVMGFSLALMVLSLIVITHSPIPQKA